MIKKLLLISSLYLGFALATAQQPQTSDLPPLTPPYAVDAKTAGGVAPGYKPSGASTGLVLTIGPGTSYCSGIVYDPGTTLTLTNNIVNYVYLNTSCVISQNTSGFTSGMMPLAVVTTSGGNITIIKDVRTIFTGNSSGSITALHGDGIATGPGDVSFTLANVNSNVGACGDASDIPTITLNAKGLATGCTTTAFSAANSFSMQNTPPTGATYITIYPTGFSISGVGTQYQAVGNNTSAIVQNTGCTIGNCSGSGPAKVSWTFTIPSYINPSHVTAVWASATMSAFSQGNGSGWGSTGNLSCVQNVTTYNLASDSSAYGPYYTLQQFNVLLSGVTGAQIPTITCSASVSASSVVQAGLIVNVPSIALQVADAIDTAPTSNNIVVVPPLSYNPQTKQLSLDTSTRIPVYNNSGTQSLNTHIVTGASTLSSGTKAITLSGSAVFSANNTYQCAANDNTAANAIQVVYTSGSSVTFNGTTTDAFTYTCIGN